MHFGFDEQQRSFQSAVRDLLAAECPPAAVRAAWDGDTAAVATTWAKLAEMGVLGLLVPEEHGGLGLGEVDLVLLLEETGRAALPSPVLSTAAVAAPLLRDHAPEAVAAAWLPRIATGDAAVVVGFEGAPNVVDADIAHLLVMQSGPELYAVDPAAASLRRERSVDGSRRLFTVDWEPHHEARLTDGDGTWAAVNQSYDRAALGSAAQLVGLADRMVEMTVAYTLERRQFGVPIGSFQAVKHHLADALLKVEFARPLVYRAAASVAGADPDAGMHVSMAKAAASDAATAVAATCLQCHGAIGYTVEHDLHLWMKRAWVLATRFGDASFHRRRVATAVLG